jgi:hypothetical protein
MVAETVSGSGLAYGREMKNAPGGQRNSLKRLDSDKERKSKEIQAFFLGSAWPGLCRAWLHLGKFGSGLAARRGRMIKLL